jgi:diaminopimelate epimerase
VELDGGKLQLEWRESDNHMLMTGPGTTVFLGQLDLDAYGH